MKQFWTRTLVEVIISQIPDPTSHIPDRAGGSTIKEASKKRASVFFLSPRKKEWGTQQLDTYHIPYTTAGGKMSFEKRGQRQHLDSNKNIIWGIIFYSFLVVLRLRDLYCTAYNDGKPAVSANNKYSEQAHLIVDAMLSTATPDDELGSG